MTLDALPSTPTYRAVVQVDACPCPEQHLLLTYCGNIIRTGFATGLAALMVSPEQQGHSTLINFLEATGPLPDTVQITAGPLDPRIFLFGLNVPLTTRQIGPGVVLHGDGSMVPGPGMPTLRGSIYRKTGTLKELPLTWRIDWKELGLTDTAIQL